MYKQLIDYTECERLIAGAKSPLYDGGDLYPWTNNDSLIDWSGVNRNTIQDDEIGSWNSTSPTKQTAPVLPPFELYQVGWGRGGGGGGSGGGGAKLITGSKCFWEIITLSISSSLLRIFPTDHPDSHRAGNMHHIDDWRQHSRAARLHGRSQHPSAQQLLYRIVGCHRHANW